MFFSAETITCITNCFELIEAEKNEFELSLSSFRETTAQSKIAPLRYPSVVKQNVSYNSLVIEYLIQVKQITKEILAVKIPFQDPKRSINY